MEQSDSFENLNIDEFNVRLLESIPQDVNSMHGRYDSLDLQSNDPFTVLQELQELDSCSESLALLQSLGNFDPSRKLQEENFGATNEQISSFLDSNAPNSYRERPKQLRDYFDSSSASVVTTFSREVSPACLVYPENSQENFQNPPSPSFSLESETPPPRSRLPSIQSVNNDAHHSTLSKHTGRKKTLPVVDADLTAREWDIWGPPDDDEGSTAHVAEQNEAFNVSPTQTLSSSAAHEARLAGIYSAAALFRRPSAASKKYTRAPISKIFVSLDLTAEMFLKLQAAAKTYMLDEKFPERREAVGTKRRADNDLIKLKLYSCVRCFLEEEGWGERCYGSNAEGANQRKLRWPDSKNKIIQLVTPLMRRMVTNERQRQYALETRTEKRLKNSQKRLENLQTSGLSENSRSTSERQDSEITPNSPDLALDRARSLLSPSQATPESHLNSADLNQSQNDPTFVVNNSPNGQLKFNNETNSVESELQTKPENKTMLYHINFLLDGYRVKEKLVLTPNECPSFSSLIHHITKPLDHSCEQVGNIKIHGPDGLVNIFDQTSWVQTLYKISEHEWMDQEVRCLVKLEISG